MRAWLRLSGLIASSCLLLCAVAGAADEPRVANDYTSLDAATVTWSDSLPEFAIDSELEAVLRNWQRANSKINRLDADYFYIENDVLRDIVRHGQGQLAVDSYGRGFITLTPSKVGPGFRETGNPAEQGQLIYKVEPVESFRYHWTGTHIIFVDDELRNYRKCALPLDDRNLKYSPSRPLCPAMPEDLFVIEDQEPIALAPAEKIKPDISTNATSNREPSPTIAESLGNLVGLMIVSAFFDFSGFTKAIEECMRYEMSGPPLTPFLLEMSLEELTQRYEISLVEQLETEIRLQFVSKQEVLVGEKTLLILGRDQYQPKALKIFDQSGETSRVYIFKNVRINTLPNRVTGDLGQPDLRGYRREAASPN